MRRLIVPAVGLLGWVSLAGAETPAALDDQLDYVSSLVSSSEGGCGGRLDQAQFQLDTAAADPAFEVVLPAARARQADLEYRIHSARAAPGCGADPAARGAELRAALDAARRAADFYREALDYPSAATMQFDAAVVQRMLGRDAAALATLQVAIGMDREYGFHDDLVENYKLLAQWTGKRAAVADSASRRTTLKFAWSIRNAHLTLDFSYAGIQDGQVVHYHAGRTFTRTYRLSILHWHRADEPGTVRLDVPDWPQQLTEHLDLGLALERDLLEAPEVQITREGDFDRVIRLNSLSDDLSAATRALFLHTGPQGTRRLPALVTNAVDVSFAPQVVEDRAAENYNFDTAIWIGATLEQGVWYKMSAPLSLAGARQLSLPHDVEFAFTRQVPCEPDSTDASCVELVVRATPEESALEGFTTALSKAVGPGHGATAQYWEATWMRIVTDPNTLMTYVRDVRRYWHIATGGTAAADTSDHSERVVATSDYR